MLLCLSVVILLFFFSLIYFCYGVYAFTAFTLSLGGRKGIQPVQKLSGGVLAWFCLERGADLHTAQLMPLPLTVSYFSKIQIDFTFVNTKSCCLSIVLMATGQKPLKSLKS